MSNSVPRGTLPANQDLRARLGIARELLAYASEARRDGEHLECYWYTSRAHAIIVSVWFRLRERRRAAGGGR